MALITDRGPADASEINLESLKDPQFPVLEYRIKDLVEFSKLIL